MRNLAIIPARSGSKRVPRKNIRPLDGKPLIVHSIDFALASGFFDKVVVSTDSSEIASIARSAGAEVPFLRPEELSEDHIADKPVIQHCINWLKNNDDYSADLIWYLKPTSPIRKTSDLIAISDHFNQKKPDSIRSVSIVPANCHPYWMFKRNENGFATPIDPGIDINKFYQSQLLPPVFKLNGVYEVISMNTLLNNEFLYGEKIWLYETDEEISVDIDTLEDFEEVRKRLNHNEIR